MLKKLIIAVIIAELIFSQAGISFACPGGLVADFLYDIALDYYIVGNFKEALHEAGKALLAEPDNKDALRLIEEIKIEQAELKETIRTEAVVEKEEKKQVILRTLDKLEEALLAEEEIRESEPYEEISPTEKEVILPPVVKIKMEEIVSPKVLEEEKKLLIAEEVPVRRKEIILPVEEKEVILPPIVEEEEMVSTEVLKETKEKAIELALVREPEEEKREIKEKAVFGMKAVINGEEFFLEHPVLYKEGKPWVSLGDIAKKIGVLVIPWRDNKFKIIRPDGDFAEIEIGKKELFKDKKVIGEIEYPPLIIDGELMVTLDSLDKLFSSVSYWDEPEQILYVDTEYITSDMDIFTIAKPKAERPLRKRVYIAPPPPWQQVAKKPFYPGELTIKPTIRHYHPDKGDISTDFELDLTGRLYDYRFQGELEWEEQNERQRYQRGYLEVSKPGQWWRFLDNSINLNPLSSQFESFKGVKFVKSPKSSFPTTFFFGETENFVSGNKGSVEYKGLIFGLGKEYKKEDSFEHKAMLIGTTNEADDPSLAGTTLYPKKNLILFTDSTIHPLPNFSLSNQLGLCSYTPDDGNNKDIQDIDWRIGSSLEKGRLTLAGSHEFVGDQYASLGYPTAYQDIQRWDIYSRYRLGDKWSVAAGYGGSQDNVDDNPAKSTTQRDIFYARTDFSLPTRQSMSLNWRRDESETEDTSGGTSCSTGNSLMAVFRQPGRIFNLLGTYQHFWRDYSTAVSDYTTDTLAISLYRSLGKGHMNLGQRISQTDYKIQDNDKKTYTTNFAFSYRVTPKWENRFSSDYTLTKNESVKDTYTLSFRYTNSYLLTRDIRSSFNYTKKKIDGDWSDCWSVFLIYSHPFDIVAPPRWGKIRGRVVQDLNNNYRIDEGEPGLAGVWIHLGDGSSVQTNEDGYYSIEKASPCRQRISLDIADLPENLGPQGKSERDILVKTRGVIEVDFMAVELGAIMGKVFIDANSNGDVDSNEEGVEGVIISLLPEDRRTKTLSDGRFSFDYVHPGKIKIELKMDSLAERYALTSVDNWQSNLPVGGKLTDVHFFVRLRLPEEMLKPEKLIIMQYDEQESEQQNEDKQG